MTVLIAIPVGPDITSELLDRAVKHALAQTHKDLVVLAAGDGCDPPVTIRDDRLVVGKFPTNHGVAFTQQAMLLGSPFRWYAPHGADDWIEPNHVASLVALRAPINGSGRIWYHDAKGRKQVLASPRTWVEFGVFDAETTRSVGGYNPAEPFGQDSVLISVLLRSQRVAIAHRPTYHKQWRAESLTQAADTGGRSEARTAVRVRNRAVLQECARLRWRTGEVRRYRQTIIPAKIRKAVEKSAEQVAKWLA